ncbi:ATP-binding protein [Halanaerocella petrolearia]
MSLNKSKLVYIKSALILQFFSSLLLIINMYYNLFTKKLSLGIILFIIMGISILMMSIIGDLFKLIDYKTKYELQDIKLEEQNEWIKKLRKHKHDFSNHLQTIYGMIQLNKDKEEIKEYIKSINQDLNKLNFKRDKVSDSILDSLLIGKQIKAKKLGIQFDYQVDPGVEGINLSIDKVFRIVSNLVDNALDATTESTGERMIKVKGYDDGDLYLLLVFNTGSFIDKESRDQIFKLGYSNKGEVRGLGLNITQSLVQKADGKLEVRSVKDLGTEFMCYLPK